MGLYPALVVLGIYDRCTPKLASDASRAVAMLSSLAEAQAQLRSDGIALDIKTLRSTAYRYAARARAAQQSAACGLLDRVTGKRVVVSLDGGLVDPLTRGDPTSPLRWTCKSRAKLAAALTEQGWRVSSTTVGRLLHRLGYRLQSPRKRQEGATHPDRNAQFEHINRTADEHLSAGQPVISVDTKKKELVGNFKNGGREWQPKGTPPAVLVHDFPTDAEGKAIPYGVYDMARNEAWVSVGWDHDTPAFAVASIRQWWRQMGCDAYPEATTLFITADAGGSNGYRLHAWKHELQQLADETGLTIEVSHFPPGTSKWNKIEHRLFCHITANWRGTPLTTYETIVDRIGNVRTETGLQVRAELDAGEYPTGVKVTKEQMEALALVRDEFHGEWNYKLLPR